MTEECSNCGGLVDFSSEGITYDYSDDEEGNTTYTCQACLEQLEISEGLMCAKCRTRFNKVNGGGCFVEYEFEHKKVPYKVFLRGLYDGTKKSRIELVIAGIKVPKPKPYSIEQIDYWVKYLEQKYNFKACRSEDFDYQVCGCDLKAGEIEN